MSQDPRYYTVEKAAEYLCLSVSYVQKLTTRRRMPFIEVGERRLYDRTLLDCWLARRAALPHEAVFPSGVENANDRA